MGDKRKFEPNEIFPNVRGFTEEEQKQYNKVLDDLFEPTGRNIFDLIAEDEDDDGSKSE